MLEYDIMYGAIKAKYENGEITYEQANELNDIAYNKYITETSKATKVKRDNYFYGDKIATTELEQLHNRENSPANTVVKKLKKIGEPEYKDIMKKFEENPPKDKRGYPLYNHEYHKTATREAYNKALGINNKKIESKMQPKRIIVRKAS